MKHILVISGDKVGSQMGGVGIRNWEIANALADTVRVTLAVPGSTDLSSDRVQLITYSEPDGDLRPLLNGVDAILTHGFVLHFHPYLKDAGIPIIFDLTVPFLLEGLVWHAGDERKEWIPHYEEYLRVQLDLLRIGDYFICANEKQRDYWLGWLHAQKRINPDTYDQDPTLRSLIDVVPFGIPEQPPLTKQPVLKGVHPRVKNNEKAILWSGGIWDWLDPITLIQALSILRSRELKVKLCFLGSQHPNPIVTGMTMPGKVDDLIKVLGLEDDVIRITGWTPYEERANYLQEADVSVISHPAHLETHFSFRTRIMDCLWAGVPIVITAGDSWADLVESEKIGIVVPPNDATAMADAIQSILFSDIRVKLKEQIARFRAKFYWKDVVQPLAMFCANPSLAVDKGKYLTESERLVHAKEAFIQKVIADKDAHLAKVVFEKDQFLNKLIADKDRYCQGEIDARDKIIQRLTLEKGNIGKLVFRRIKSGFASLSRKIWRTSH